MPTVRRTRDPNLWFSHKNWRDDPQDQVRHILADLIGGQQIELFINGVATRWRRFAGGHQALRGADESSLATWRGIPAGAWVTVTLAEADPTPTGSLLAKEPEQRSAPARGVQDPPPATSRPAERLFDAYLMVDWSAQNSPGTRPGPNQIWLGELVAENSPTEHWLPTRAACAAHVTARLLDHVEAGRRALVGFDFPYGYPAGFTAALGIPTPVAPWLAIWDVLTSLLRDDAANRNNRFRVAAALNAMATPPDDLHPGPFWGAPEAHATLSQTRPVFPFLTRTGSRLSEWRKPETHLKSNRLRPQSVFKLLGRGSVGSQALTGLPAVHRLRQHTVLRDVSLVWPFETGFSAVRHRRPFVLHAEIWPGLVQRAADQIVAAEPEVVRDRAQVRAMCEWAQTQDLTGELEAFLAQPPALDAANLSAVITEEGWTLGAML